MHSTTDNGATCVRQTPRDQGFSQQALARRLTGDTTVSRDDKP